MQSRIAGRRSSFPSGVFTQYTSFAPVSKCLSLVCDNVKSDEVCDKELILLQRDRLISCNKKILLTPAFHLVHGVHAIKFQDDHIFEEFSREHTTTENKVAGTGLGLPIVKSMIELMGGSIRVESTQGAGTKFTVDISFDTASEEDVYRNQISEQPDALKRMEGKRILLAEDNDLNAEIAIELLAEQKIIADRAMDGADCLDKLEKAASGYYDMILMDIQMPVMDGYDAAARIRRMKDEEKASIPIIAMTANAFAEDRQKAISTGMNDHVAKPIDMKVLLPVMAKYIR
jgi:CheY-like chemotaxis protein